MPTLKIKYDTDTWLAYISEERGWQPIPYARNKFEKPSLFEACLADPITYLDPNDFCDVEVIS